ncbi:MAG: 2-dehydro-3-deoxygluconokinase [Rhodospirillaceae bacterium]|nr:2-dehydro-3-deoxygluconokinase [Rhodospirillaceae bacterium]
MERRLDIVCMGEPMLEFTRVMDDEGRSVFMQGFGGDTSNCAIAAARQGAKVGYVTALGTDRFGDLYMDLWKDEGIDVSAVARDPDAPTGIYFIEPMAEGRDFTYYRKGSAASRMSPDSLHSEPLSRTRILLISAISQAISESACKAVSRAIEIARNAGALIAYDTNLRLNLWDLEVARRVIHETARIADIVMPSIDEARVLTGLDEVDRIVDFYCGFEPRILALKCGADGAVLAADGQVEAIPPIAVQVVDTSGAGDTFCGAFLARLATGDDPFDAGRHAVTAAGLSTTGYGAVNPIPRASDVNAAMIQFDSREG